MDPHATPVPHQAPANGTGRLVVDCSHLPSAVFLQATGPMIEINGHAIKANWGPWPVELAPGKYRLRVFTRYMGQMGPAETQVVVAAGAETKVFYRAPATVFSPGSIGATPQATSGMGGLIAIFVVLFVLAIVMPLVILAG